MTRLDVLRKELAELEEALPDARDFLGTWTEIRFFEEALEIEEFALWLKQTSPVNCPA